MELTTNEWTTEDPCTLNGSNIDGPCCMGEINTDLQGAFPGECEQITNAYTLTLVQSIR